MYELEFEVSTYLGTNLDSSGVALIPLDLAEGSEVTILLSNATSASEIAFSVTSISAEVCLNKLFIASPSTCKVGFKEEGQTLKLALLSTSNVTFNSSCSCIIANQLEMQGYNIDTFLPVAYSAHLHTIPNCLVPQ